MKTTFSKSWPMMAVLALFAVVLLLAPEHAFAADSNVGSSLLTDIQGILRGNLGVVVGLAISLFGLWMWLAQQSSWGLLIVIAGAALTAFPGIYGNLSQGFRSAFQTSQGDASQAKTQ